jgi:predicted enzyme related to lactoylglutathione lyase
MSTRLPVVGSVTWTDLTVPNATAVSAFYSAVVGWKGVSLDMGGYNDFCMNEPKSGKTVAGVCHARGFNADLPPQWLIYITVGDLNASLRQCRKLGGKVLRKTRSLGEGRYNVIQDPAGAVAALFEPKRPAAKAKK